MSTTTQTLRIYWQHIRNYKKYIFGLAFGMPIVIIMHQIIPPIIAADILDKLATTSTDTSALWSTYGMQLIIYGIFVVVSGSILWRIVIYLIWKLENYTTRDLARTMFYHLAQLDTDFHANSFGGSLVSRTNKFTNAYIRIADTFWFNLYSLLIMYIATSIILWPRSPLFVVVLLLFSVAYIYTSFILTKPVRVLASKSADQQNKQTGYIADMVTNIMAIKSFSSSTYENSKFNNITEKTRLSLDRVMWSSLFRETYFGAATSVISAISLVIAVISVVVYNANIGTVFLILAYTSNLTQRLWDFPQSALRNLNRAFGDAEEATLTLMRESTVKDIANPKTFEFKKGTIVFNNVSFSHDSNELFHNLNLEIKQGEKIGLVGPSGGGKTTITKLILRFMDIQNGEITIDGQNIAELKQEDLRNIISYVPQEPLLFHRSLKENITYGRLDATKNEIEEASLNAHANEFIANLPDGNNTLVGERGIKLSGGQKQRVAIARALLKKAPILLLDEATSALDSESEQLIQDALWKLMKDKTAIVIAHRLSTIQKMDRIIVLDKGKIVEEGSHSELVKKKNGLYARLWKHQSGGFLKD